MEIEEVKTQKFIIKFFPEIMIKGTAARRQQINQLSNNLIKLLKRINENIESKKFSDKIEIVCPIEFSVETRQILLQTPGVGVILEAVQYNKINTLDEIKVLVNDILGHTVKNKTFVVRAKRTGTHDFKSTQIEQTVGGYMLAHNDTKGVDLKNPDIKVNIELVHNQLNVVTLKHNGLGGFPIGSQGQILSLMSGGFDSTVASYLTMKRGIKTHFIFFNLGGIAHEIGVKQVASFLWNKFGSSHNVSFITVPFEDVVTEIFRSTAETYMGVTLKRLMLKASEKIADDMGIDALVTGESVAQVSSQTLRNLSLIDQATSKLILRPLSTMHKQDIMKIANDIGTRRFAETMPEYCGVISKNPVIHGSFKRMEVESRKFDYSVLDAAVDKAVSVKAYELVEDISDISQIESVSDISSGEYTIIDIRQSDDCIKTSCETLKIPFHKLKSEFKNLPQEKEYLLYCDKGILSQLHAQYLIDAENFTNIRVYRP
jgi:tRNA uracil 4-sulfurtransferase